MLFQFLPRLSEDEYAALEASIREHGVQVPILVDENRSVIDGHHRKEIAERLGVDCPKRMVLDLDDTAKRTLALSLNLDRRHLTREQKRELVASSLKADPQLSDRGHAERTGTSHPTVAKVRRQLESFTTSPEPVDRETGEINPPAIAPRAPSAPAPEPRPIQGRDGKTYTRPASKPAPDPERERQREALAEFTATPADVQYRQNFRQAYQSALGLTQYDPERVGQVIDADQWDLLLQLPGDLAKFVTAVRAHRPRNLRSIK